MNKNEELTINFLQWFNNIAPINEISKDSITAYVSSNIQFYLNGELLAVGLDAYHERINALFAPIKSLEIQLPVENLVVEANRAAVNYREHILFKDGGSRTIINGMFLHFDDQGKIEKLYDVFNGIDPAQGIS